MDFEEDRYYNKRVYSFFGFNAGTGLIVSAKRRRFEIKTGREEIFFAIINKFNEINKTSTKKETERACL